MKTGFLILHYNATEITKKCVTSIQNLDGGKDTIIIIVDNASSNGSGQELLEEYQKTEQVEVILAKENLGFSRGNNLGYQEMKKKYKLDFLVVTNNDILFLQRDFLQRIEISYIENKFFLMGPDVWAVYKKEHQSPISSHPKSLQEINEWIDQIECWKRRLKRDTVLNVIINLVQDTRIYKKYRKVMDKKYPPKQIFYGMKQEDVVLVGACLILSADFIEANEKVFTPETFFYNEEDILTERCIRNGWKIVYDPELQVHHLEGASTRQTANGYYRRQKFLYKNFEDSARIYKDYLLEREEND